MAVSLPYYPRKYTCEWLETLRQDTRVWADLELEIYGKGCFPDSDGEPLGETDWHIKATMDTLQTLQRHFAERPSVYIQNGRGYSEQLGLVMECHRCDLQFIVPNLGQTLPLSSELVEMLGTERQRAERATALAEAEARARRDAEAKIARLRAELDALRKTE